VDIALVGDDIVIEDGDLRSVDEPQATGQRIRDRLLTFRGEWFLDLLFGPDYRADVFLKNPNSGHVSAVLKEEILKSIDNGRITAFEVSLGSDRTMHISCSVENADGQVSVEATV
jgi:hypothetical protein